MAVKKAGWIFLAKCAVLLAVDTACVYLFFSVWRLYMSPVFSFALVNVLLALFLANAALLAAPYLERALHVFSSPFVLTLAAIYLLFTLVFTGLSYLWIAPGVYAGVAGTALFVFAGATALSCAKPWLHREWDRLLHRQGDVRDVRVLLMEVESALSGVSPQLDPRQAGSLQKAYTALRERLEFSTPFGRSDIPVVRDMEDRIADRLAKSAETIRRLGGGEAAAGAASELMEIAELVKNREKLIHS